MSCCLKSHVKGLRTVSWSNRKVVGAAAGYRVFSTENRDPPNSGQLFNTWRSTGWKPKMASSSLYLDELLIQKCNSDIVLPSNVSLERLPRRVHTTLTKPVWRTHLLRNILSNYWCGVPYTCTNTSVKPDRNGWMIRSEKLCEGNLSTSLLEGFSGSDVAQSDCENRTVVWFEKGWKTTCRYLA